MGEIAPAVHTLALPRCEGSCAMYVWERERECVCVRERERESRDLCSFVRVGMYLCVRVRVRA